MFLIYKLKSLFNLVQYLIELMNQCYQSHALSFSFSIDALITIVTSKFSCADNACSPSIQLVISHFILLHLKYITPFRQGWGSPSICCMSFNSYTNPYKTIISFLSTSSKSCMTWQTTHVCCATYACHVTFTCCATHALCATCACYAAHSCCIVHTLIMVP